MASKKKQAHFKASFLSICYCCSLWWVLFVLCFSFLLYRSSFSSINQCFIFCLFTARWYEISILYSGCIYVHIYVFAYAYFYFFTKVLKKKNSSNIWTVEQFFKFTIFAGSCALMQTSVVLCYCDDNYVLCYCD